MRFLWKRVMPLPLVSFGSPRSKEAIELPVQLRAKVQETIFPSETFLSLAPEDIHVQTFPAALEFPSDSVCASSAYLRSVISVEPPNELHQISRCVQNRMADGIPLRNLTFHFMMPSQWTLR
jgi:hypothetical protein